MWLLLGHIKRCSVVILIFWSNIYSGEKQSTLSIVKEKRIALEKKQRDLKLLQEVAAIFKDINHNNSTKHAENLLKMLRAPERGGMSSERREALIAMYLRKNKMNPYPRHSTPTAALMNITQPFFEF